MIHRRYLLLMFVSFLGSAIGTCSRAQQQEEIKGAVAEPSDAAEVRSQIKTVEKLESVLPDRAAALYFLAAAKQHLGETLDALKLLKECLASREGFDPAAEPAFRGLKDSKEFTEMVESARRE